MNQTVPLILVDGSSYLFRAFHGSPGFTNPAGHPTGAIRGVVSMLRKLSRDYPGSTIAVVFDPKGKTFRDDIYSDYKANRPPMDPDLAIQIAPIHEIIRAMGLPLMVVERFEADDVIGTLAKQATDAGLTTLISTSDKDMAQLVNDRVTLFDSMSNRLTDSEGVVKKFGVRANQMIDFLALVGDTSDNIPGVPRVGPKTAAKWLHQYDTLEGVIANAEAIKGAVGQSLRDNLEQLELSRTLATIRLDVELEVSAAELQSKSPDEQALEELFEHWNFQKFLDEMRAARGEAKPVLITDRQVHYQIVSTPEELESLVDSIRRASRMSLHIETSSPSATAPRICGIAIATREREGAYIPIGHDAELHSGFEPRIPQLPQQSVLAALSAVLADASVSKIGCDLKQSWKILRAHDLLLEGVSCDVQLLSYLIDNLSPGGHGTGPLAQRYLNRSLQTRQELVGSGRKEVPSSAISISRAQEYCCAIADANLGLGEALQSRLRDQSALMKLYESIDLPLSLALARMELKGVFLDVAQLKELSTDLAASMSELATHAFALAGMEFMLSSPKRLADVLYDKLALTAPRQSKSGHRSTAEPVLEKLASEHELPGVVLDYRKLAVLKGTYADALPTVVDQTTNRVHTHYQQTVASSSRVASQNPNLQNIPNRTEAGRKIRRAFAAPAGYQILAADYSQIELRLMAHASGDQGLVRAFKQDQDVHRATAAEVFDKAIGEVNEEDRQKAKAINFGLIYGMSAFGLSERLGLTRTEAKRYHEKYFERYPKVKEFMESTKQQARENEYVETFLGRRLYVANIKSRVPAQRAAADRTAINAPIQGGAADIIKLATVSMDRWLEESDIDAHMIMQVHDELVFEVSSDAVAELCEKATEIMESAAELLVPLVVHVGWGSDWEAAH